VVTPVSQTHSGEQPIETSQLAPELDLERVGYGLWLAHFSEVLAKRLMQQRKSHHCRRLSILDVAHFERGF